LFITVLKSGVKNEKISRLRANTLANAAIIANSQLSANIGPSKGISFINGVVKGAKIKDIMESAVELEVPNKVDYESGPNWGTIK